jgi:hypothetical protein
MVEFGQEWPSHFHFMSDVPRKGICHAVVKQKLSQGGFALCPRYGGFPSARKTKWDGDFAVVETDPKQPRVS